MFHVKRLSLERIDIVAGLKVDVREKECMKRNLAKLPRCDALVPARFGAANHREIEHAERRFELLGEQFRQGVTHHDHTVLFSSYSCSSFV
jgi:hypothetical protein